LKRDRNSKEERKVNVRVVERKKTGLGEELMDFKDSQCRTNTSVFHFTSGAPFCCCALSCAIVGVYAGTGHRAEVMRPR
jgi:hypothetical protein